MSLKCNQNETCTEWLPFACVHRVWTCDLGKWMEISSCDQLMPSSHYIILSPICKSLSSPTGRAVIGGKTVCEQRSSIIMCKLFIKEAPWRVADASQMPDNYLAWYISGDVVRHGVMWCQVMRRATTNDSTHWVEVTGSAPVCWSVL